MGVVFFGFWEREKVVGREEEVFFLRGFERRALGLEGEGGRGAPQSRCKK